MADLAQFVPERRYLQTVQEDKVSAVAARYMSELRRVGKSHLWAVSIVRRVYFDFDAREQRTYYILSLLERERPDA